MPGIMARAFTSAVARSDLERYPASYSLLALLRPTPRRETRSTSSSVTPYLILTVSGRILRMASGLKM